MTPETGSKLLLIVAHCDDETIGAAALLMRRPESKIVHVTEGAPEDMRDARAVGFATQDAYAAARNAEVQQAMALVGISPQAIHNLRYVDQRVSCRLPKLVRDLFAIFQSERPDTVLTHAYEGGHPDHDATAFACRAAQQLCAHTGGFAPRLMEFAGYHGQDGTLVTNRFLNRGGYAEIRHELSSAEKALKTKMLQAFVSQTKTLQPFFPPEFEAYRDAPAYDFTSAPHAGPLFYEHFDWGINGARWRALAHEALAELSVLRSCA